MPPFQRRFHFHFHFHPQLTVLTAPALPPWQRSLQALPRAWLLWRHAFRDAARGVAELAAAFRAGLKPCYPSRYGGTRKTPRPWSPPTPKAQVVRLLPPRLSENLQPHCCQHRARCPAGSALAPFACATTVAAFHLPPAPEAEAGAGAGAEAEPGRACFQPRPLCRPQRSGASSTTQRLPGSRRFRRLLLGELSWACRRWWGPRCWRLSRPPGPALPRSGEQSSQPSFESRFSSRRRTPGKTSLPGERRKFRHTPGGRRRRNRHSR